MQTLAGYLPGFTDDQVTEDRKGAADQGGDA